jgi:hypothetical protein
MIGNLDRNLAHVHVAVNERSGDIWSNANESEDFVNRPKIGIPRKPKLLRYVELLSAVWLAPDDPQVPGKVFEDLYRPAFDCHS